MWAPDVYEGAPTSVTAFMSVGAEGRRVCRDRAGVPYRVPELAGGLDRDTHRRCHPLDGGGKYPGPCPDQYQADARVLVHRPCRVYAARDHRRHSKRAQRRLDLSSHLCFHEHGGLCRRYPPRQGGRNQGLRGSGKKPSARSGRHAGVHVFLTGIPPTAGFIGKIHYLPGGRAGGACLGRGDRGDLQRHIAYYYLRVVRNMYMRERAEATALRPSWSLGLAICLTVLMVFIIGVMPSVVIGR